MKYITLLFTTIFFLAFAEVQAAVDIEPAFPTWVESGLDPPDCIVEGVSKMETCHYTVIGNKIFRQQPPAYQSSATTRINSITHTAFVYRCFTAAGGVGRLCSDFCLVFIPNPATHNDFLNVLNGTSGGMGRIQG